jgi:hypothetical protein
LDPIGRDAEKSRARREAVRRGQDQRDIGGAREDQELSQPLARRGGLSSGRRGPAASTASPGGATAVSIRTAVQTRRAAWQH